MRYILTILVTVFVSACGKSHVDSEFIPYVNLFKDAARSQGATMNAPNLTIQFADQTADASTIQDKGKCDNQGGVGGQTITIYRQFWESASDTQKELVLFHELGHCVLGREHLDDTTYDASLNNIPKSIMHSGSLVDDANYSQNRDAYVYELFHPGVFKLN